MLQFAVFSNDPNLESALEFIRKHNLQFEIHLNRTRFWVPEGSVLTEFLLRFDSYRPVRANEDLATGRINTL